MWLDWYPLYVAAVSLQLIYICQYIFSSDFFYLVWRWALEIENCLSETKIKFGRNEILLATAVSPTCADPFVSLIGGDHAVGINGLASWKMGTIWSRPGRSGSGLQWAETCHLPTHATAWSFYHLALTRLLIPGLCACETQWIGTVAQFHWQGFKPVKFGFFFFSFSLINLYNTESAPHNAGTDSRFI